MCSEERLLIGKVYESVGVRESPALLGWVATGVWLWPEALWVDGDRTGTSLGPPEGPEAAPGWVWLGVASS